MLVAKDNFIVRTGKGILSFSLASVIRTALGGLNEGGESLRDTYRAVAPFYPLKYGAGRKILALIPAVPLTYFGEVQEPMTMDLRYVDVDGTTPFRDLVAILSLAKLQQPKAALEFGTYFGSTTANLAMNLPDARIHTIDLPEDDTAASALVEGRPIDDLHLIKGRQLGKAFRGTPLEQRIVQHQGDTATYDYSVIQDPVSFVLVDGSHTYDYARSDTLRAFSVAKGECTFLWHDCDEFNPGVLKWLVEMIRAGLPVVRIEHTVLACMKIDAQDARILKLMNA